MGVGTDYLSALSEFFTQSLKISQAKSGIDQQSFSGPMIRYAHMSPSPLATLGKKMQ